MNQAYGIATVFVTIALILLLIVFWFFIIPLWFGSIISHVMQFILYVATSLLTVAGIIFYCKDVQNII